MRKLIVIFFALLLLMPVTTATGQIVRKRDSHQSSSTTTQEVQKIVNQKSNTPRSSRTTRPSTGRGKHRVRGPRRTSRPVNRYNDTRREREYGPLYDVSFGCNANGAVIIIDDEEYNVDDSCMLRAGSYPVEVEADGYRLHTETIEVDEENTYFYFELEEMDDDEIASQGWQTDNGEMDDEPVAQQTTAFEVEIKDLPNEQFTVNGVTFTMVYVQGGTYTRYQIPDNVSLVVRGNVKQGVPPAHKVSLSSYYIGMYEVTQELWKAVMADDREVYGPHYPFDNASWNDCNVFISKLNALTGKKFRLPTDAEWEYAARGGAKSKGYVYSGSNNIDDVAWYVDNSEIEYHDVGTKAPNELGIYDMSGSVPEWCADWWDWPDVDENTPPLINPTGKEFNGNRVYRGGGYSNDSSECCVFRYYNDNPESGRGMGFRIAL